MTPLTDLPQMASGSNKSPIVRSGRKYAHPAIAEAVIEMQCELPPSITLGDLAQVGDVEGFSLTGGAVHVSGRVNVSPEGIKGDTSGEQIGHVFQSHNGRRSIQARLNGFAYVAHQSYDDWESFFRETWSHWLSYQRTARPIRATRLAARYVNQINIPQATIEIKDYLRTAIEVSPYLPQAVAGYFLQVVVPLSNPDIFATISSAIVPPVSPGYTSLILDIDTWMNVSISLNSSPGNEEIESRLQAIREAKNHVFEACITDATRGLIS